MLAETDAGMPAEGEHVGITDSHCNDSCDEDEGGEDEDFAETEGISCERTGAGSTSCPRLFTPKIAKFFAKNPRFFTPQNLKFTKNLPGI
jgi:hypothetical protein